ncbi:porin [Paraburkholderia rhizosphaerae]|uniref:Putative porin n=1 Tax=Paraburkholderia rhizosphaerae TaxID=480658 RepID=A0A4V6QD49_9BURK|nr:porin [Paraburkholderia rhizosphaerae]TDY51571.1 putative porin [Paraburkholderia rhizosphaerae]
MKWLAMTAALCAAGISGTSYAQSSVTLYGIIDDSIQYTHNTGGASNQIKLQSGQMSISQWGVRGTEDLGDGLSALFNLQNGFNVNNGNMNSGLLFGRKAYVGLAGHFGTVTIGRQQDTLQDFVLAVQGDAFLEYFTAPGDIDNADGSVRTSNAVKWTSPSWRGLQAAAMYGFGGVAGSVASGQSYNAAVNYSHGPLTLAAGYAHIDNGNPTVSMRGTSSVDSIFLSPVNDAYATASAINIARAGATYALGPVTLGGYYSYSEYLPDGHSTFQDAERFNNGSVFAAWQATPVWLFETGYNILKSHGDSSATYQQVTLAVDYTLSRRTDLYGTASYGHASGSNGLGPAQAVISDAFVDGGKTTQELVIAGIRHRF